MSETCIVCLGPLAEKDSTLPHSHDLGELEAASSPDTVTANDNDDANGSVELIAHLLPCGHDLHDDCLKPWVERANSCPICRQNFNVVQVSNVIGGTLSFPRLQDLNAYFHMLSIKSGSIRSSRPRTGETARWRAESTCHDVLKVSLE